MKQVPPHLHCPYCGGINRVVNGCCCDPDNLPTPDPWPPYGIHGVEGAPPPVSITRDDSQWWRRSLCQN